MKLTQYEKRENFPLHLFVVNCDFYRMIEGFLDEKRQNPSNKLDLAFFWSLVKEDGKDVCSMYQKLLIRLGIMEEEREDVLIDQVKKSLYR
jgi:hypothetical protein